MKTSLENHREMVENTINLLTFRPATAGRFSFSLPFNLVFLVVSR